MFRSLGIASAVLVFGLVACSSEEAPNDNVNNNVPDNNNVNNNNVVVVPDAGTPDTGVAPVDAGQPDAGAPDTGVDPIVPTEVTLSGRVIKLGEYLAGNNDYVGEAAVLAYGVNPQQSTISSAQVPIGNYTLTLPANGQSILVTQKLGYEQTFSNLATQTTPIENNNIYITENAWLSAIADAHNVTLGQEFDCQTAYLSGQQCRYAAIVGKVQDDGTVGNGVRRPVANVPANAFTITGTNNQPWYIRGPYFLDYDGTPEPDATGTITYQDGQGEYQGGLYATFVEVPARGDNYVAFQMNINYAAGAGNRYFGPVTFQAFRSAGTSVTYANIYETGVPVDPVPVGDVDFDTQVYPLFGQVNVGGLGCVGCHGGENAAAGMRLDTADYAYQSLSPNDYPQRVNVQSPGDSYVLTKPLYNSPQNETHPIFAFVSPDDTAYQLIYQWIQEGALRNAPIEPVSFYNEVRPLLYNATNATPPGAGCIQCHGQGGPNQTGGFYVGGDGNDLYDELTAEEPNNGGVYEEVYRINTQYPERSLVLTNPLTGNEEPHPVKIFFDNTDPRYQLIYRWIAEGANNDTP